MMSSSAKKSGGGGTMGISQKLDFGGSGGGNGGGLGVSSLGAKGDGLSTTPSKSSKHGVTKSKNHHHHGHHNTPNSKNSGGGLLGGSGNADLNSAILPQQALEALYSTTYLEDFMDCNDNMGDDLIRQTTRMFEMGSNYMTYIRELESAMAILLGEEDADIIIPDQLSGDKKKAVFRLQNVLMTAQDTGDDSLQVMQSIQDHIENKTRQLDVDRKNLAEFCKEHDTPETPFKDPPPPPTERNIKRARRNRHEIYRPSILGPSSLKATSYPENNVNSRHSDHHSDNVVVSSRSRGHRDKEERSSRATREERRGEDRETRESSVDSKTQLASQDHNQVASGQDKSSGAGGGAQSSDKSGDKKENSQEVGEDGGGGSGEDATSGDKTEEKNATSVNTTSSSGSTQEKSGGSGTGSQKSNGRTSERTGGQTTRSSTSAQNHHHHHGHHHGDTNSSRESGEGRRASGQGYTSGSGSKSKSQKQAQEKKTKKRKAKTSGSGGNRKEDNSPQTYGIDPDEPTYCLCDQVSYGEMIGCDNDLCPIEWFHFSCVNLSTKPKGKWFCPNCRGEKPNVMKPKNVFLKELEKYNREKEEKA